MNNVNNHTTTTRINEARKTRHKIEAAFYLGIVVGILIGLMFG